MEIVIRRANILTWLCWLPCALVFAGEPYLEFTRALRDRGYGDIAVLYLQQSSTRTDLPASIRDVLDLELSNSYRAWSDQTGDTEQANQRLQESRRLLEQFSAKFPQHPGLAQALLENGDRAFGRAERIWKRAEKLADPALRSKSTTDAQQAFQESLRHLRLAAERFKQLDASLSVESALPRTGNANGAAVEELQQRVQLGLTEARFKAGAAELYLSRTFAKANESEQTSHLRKAAEDFEWAYRRYPNTELGLRALLWQAKATEELGQDSDALELYDDVLTAEADANGKLTDVAALFGQAAFWRLQLIVRVQGDETARNEANTWLRGHRAWHETGPYRGIALECAKALLRRAKNEPAKIQEKLTNEAMVLLAIVAASPGEFQNEAIRLQRAKGVLAEADPSKADWLVTGDTAMAAGQWTTAITAYEAAADAARTNPDRAAMVTARNRLNFARYRLATSLYAAGKMDESLRVAGVVAKSGTTEPHAAEAASLTCFAALALYESASERLRTEAGARLERIADFTQKTWPDQPPAHDAQIVLGHWEVKREQWEDAVKRFDEVPESSSRFATAAFSAARIYWKLALDEKRKPDEKSDDAVVKKWSEKARAKLDAAVRSLTLSDAETSTHRSWFDCCLLLAEINLEENQVPSAIELLKPLLARFPLTAKPSESDSFAVALHVLGLRAYTDSAQLDLAEDSAVALCQFGADTAAVNGALLKFLQVARKEFQDARIALDRVKGTFQQAFLQESADRMQRRQKSLTSIVSSLATRKQLNLPSLAFIAETCGILELKEPAQQVCQRILNEVDAANGPNSPDGQYASKARFQLAVALKDQENFDEALKHLERLATEHPNSLELLMKKGEVLQAWAKKDSKHYDDCIAHWTHTRLLLSRVRPRPKEYYLVIYNTALCLSEQSQVTKDTVKLQQAQQLLKSTMALNAGLDGPETRQKFESLLARLQASK